MASLEEHIVALRFLRKHTRDKVPDLAMQALIGRFNREAGATCYNHLDELIALCDAKKLAIAERELVPDFRLDYNRMLREARAFGPLLRAVRLRR